MALNNIEIVSAAIIDNTSGNPMMVPGVRTAGVCPVPPTDNPDGSLGSIGITVQLVQAMDPCSPGTPVGLLPNVCAAANTVTDGTMFTRGKIVVRRHSARYYLQSSSIGSPLAGHTLQLIMLVRATDPASLTQVTHADQLLVCPPVVVPASGNVGTGQDLVTNCGLSPTGLTENDEFLDYFIFDVGSGKILARAGVRHN